MHKLIARAKFKLPKQILSSEKSAGCDVNPLRGFSTADGIAHQHSIYSPSKALFITLNFQFGIIATKM